MSSEVVTRFNDVAREKLLSGVPDNLLTLTTLAAPVVAHTSATMTTEDVSACCDLVRDNLKTLYEASSWGWDATRKREEMEEPDARFLLLFFPLPLPSTSTDARKDVPDDDDAQRRKLMAFSSFRVEEDGDAAVLYCYELQVHPDLRGEGVGTGLMTLMERIAVRHGVHKTMLTVFTANARAVGFYRKLAYDKDASSPKDRMLRGRMISADYAILSKSLP